MVQERFALRALLGPLGLFAALVVGIFAAGPAWADDGRPQGKNCELQAPPPGSGEEVKQGAVLKVYPRIGDIDPTYVGCQTLWATIDAQVVLVSVSAIEGGFVSRVWSPDPRAHDLNACQYWQGKLVRGREDSCPDAELLLIKSMPPGCAERSLDAGHFAEGCPHD